VRQQAKAAVQEERLRMPLERNTRKLLSYYERGINDALKKKGARGLERLRGNEYSYSPLCLLLLAYLEAPSRPKLRKSYGLLRTLIMTLALLFWAELTAGAVRRFFHVMVIPAGAIALAGMFTVFFHDPVRISTV